MTAKIQCELCDLVFNRNIITRKYYEDANFMMVDCSFCGTPMLVYKTHQAEIDEVDKQMAYHLFYKHAKRVQPSQWYVDFEMRKIKTHWHAHLRKK